MVRNQSCKQNEIPPHHPKTSCYSDRSNPDGLQLDAPEAGRHNPSGTSIALEEKLYVNQQSCVP